MAHISESFTSVTAGTAKGLQGRFSVSVSGTFVGTVQLQRSHDNGTTWGVVKEYTAVGEDIGEEHAFNMLYRFECTAYTSGTITCVVVK